jgi:hypothetical protein
MSKYDRKSRPSSLQERIDSARNAWKSIHGANVRRERASARSAVSADMSPTERISVLDKRLGVGVGAQRERNRLG